MQGTAQVCCAALRIEQVKIRTAISRLMRVINTPHYSVGTPFLNSRQITLDGSKCQRNPEILLLDFDNRLTRTNLFSTGCFAGIKVKGSSRQR
jgi:hypothetical protein